MLYSLIQEPLPRPVGDSFDYYITPADLLQFFSVVGRGVQVQKKSFKMDQLTILVWSYGPTGNINGSCFKGLGVEHGYRSRGKKKKKGDFGLFLK